MMARQRKTTITSDVAGTLARVRQEARASIARLRRAGLKRIRAIDREIERLSEQQRALVDSLGAMMAQIRDVADLGARGRRGRGAAPAAASGARAGVRGAVSHLRLVGSPRWRVAPETMTLREMERDHIAAVLTSCEWNQSLAAQRLGIGRNTLMRKVKTYGLKKTAKAA